MIEISSLIIVLIGSSCCCCGGGGSYSCCSSSSSSSSFTSSICGQSTLIGDKISTVFDHLVTIVLLDCCPVFLYDRITSVDLTDVNHQGGIVLCVMSSGASMILTTTMMMMSNWIRFSAGLPLLVIF